MQKTLLAATALAALGTALAAQDSELIVLDYPGFENPDYHPAYIEQYGMSPTWSFFSDEEEAFQKVRAGFQADVTQICAGSVTKWAESGIIEPWDTSRIPEYENIDRNLTGAEVGGGEEVYFIPQNFGSTAIAYNPDEVPEEDVSTLQVFADPTYQGRVTMPDNVDDAFALGYLATGVSDWTNVTDEQFEAAADFLRAVHPNIRTYWSDPAELAQLMSTGEILISWAWNETYPTMIEEGRPIGFEREPAEGSSVWLCGYVNMADGAGSEDKAYDFINAMLDPAIAPALLESGYGLANRVALDEIDPSELEIAGIGSVDVPILAQLPIPNELREKHAETFELIKAGF
ncbi:extracellular solute-binding protein [Pseudoroseicyclus tamaricis]|uniref:Extracellular solute-binding protein n=1 Tax=Pseudoroseicyclus tamaricis TaxID=2705421 RepID=A0A6B2K1V3_9RHOB|nr:extracellular solute-binding protein [Pseudoroseicyclus tamaricis]NDV00376.1 extracellular solute-binding protein [Pseudoroseicyclus tamaricis]